MLISYLAFVFNFFKVFMNFWHICKKSKNKDFGGAIVQSQYILKGVL